MVFILENWSKPNIVQKKLCLKTNLYYHHSQLSLQYLDQMKVETVLAAFPLNAMCVHFPHLQPLKELLSESNQYKAGSTNEPILGTIKTSDKLTDNQIYAARYAQ